MPIWNGISKFNYQTIKRVDSENGRVYDINNEKLPSVTTILGATRSAESEAKLSEWRRKLGEKKADQVRDNAAARGTIMHRILEGYIKGEGHMDMSDLGQEAGIMAQNIIDRGLFKPLTEVWGLEMPLYYPGLYAGASDVVGIYEGRESIIDFKQSNKFKKREWIDDYFIQCAAYAMAHNYVYGTAIDSGVILISVKGGEVLKYVSSGAEFKAFMYRWLERVGKYGRTVTNMSQGEGNMQQEPGSIVPDLPKMEKK
jgi:genome maintenance exonuclease 1